MPRDHKRLAKALQGRAFVAIDRTSDEDRAAGFVELEDHESVEFPAANTLAGEYLLFGWRVDTLKVPGPQLKSEMEKWSKAYERDNARPPGRREKNDAKAEITRMLRSRIDPRRKVFDVSWNLQTGQVQLWATSRGVIDEIQAVISKAFEIELLPLVPAAQAERAGIKDSALKPTPELCGMEVEVANGEA